MSSGTADIDTDITTFSLLNTEIDGFYEAPTVPITASTKGIFANIGTSSQLRVENLTISNFIGSSKTVV